MTFEEKLAKLTENRPVGSGITQADDVEIRNCIIVGGNHTVHLGDGSRIKDAAIIPRDLLTELLDKAYPNASS